jgi:hypothetical protein
MNTLILDVAHGKNVPGKRSPDGVHLEYLWSRNCARSLMHKFNSISRLPFYVHCPYLSYENEPGLMNRVETYNCIVPAYDNSLMLSLHNNANHPSKCNKEGWGKAHGMSLWTKKGETKADEYATFMYKQFKKMMPDEYFRTAYWLEKGENVSDPDYEANFTVLAGNKFEKPKYEGILFEVLFQDNKDDLEKLLDPYWNMNFNHNLVFILIELFVQIINK